MANRPGNRQMNPRIVMAENKRSGMPGWRLQARNNAAERRNAVARNASDSRRHFIASLHMIEVRVVVVVTSVEHLSLGVFAAWTCPDTGEEFVGA
jgi:hypothetical protein